MLKFKGPSSLANSTSPEPYYNSFLILNIIYIPHIKSYRLIDLHIYIHTSAKTVSDLKTFKIPEDLIVFCKTNPNASPQKADSRDIFC